MSSKPRIYFDSCCFLDMLQHTVKIGDKASRTAHVFYLRKLLQFAKTGGAEVFTSTLTVAECTHVVDTAQATQPKIYTDEIKRLIDGMLLSTKSGVMPVQPTPNIIRLARDLLWVHGVSHKAMDSIHIATAINQKCDYLLTSDEPLKAKMLPLASIFALRFCYADSLKHLMPSDSAQADLELRGGMAGDATAAA